MPFGLYEVLHDNTFDGCGVRNITEGYRMFNNVHKGSHFTRKEIGESFVANSMFCDVTINEIDRNSWEKDYKWDTRMYNNYTL